MEEREEKEVTFIQAKGTGVPKQYIRAEGVRRLNLTSWSSCNYLEAVPQTDTIALPV